MFQKLDHAGDFLTHKGSFVTSDFINLTTLYFGYEKLALFALF